MFTRSFRFGFFNRIRNEISCMISDKIVILIRIAVGLNWAGFESWHIQTHTDISVWQIEMYSIRYSKGDIRFHSAVNEEEIRRTRESFYGNRMKTFRRIGTSRDMVWKEIE